VRLATGFFASLLFASVLGAQEVPARATRRDGSVVLLYANGTWKPDTASRAGGHASASFVKPASATATLDILKGATLSYDPSKWTPGANDKPGRLQLNHHSGDGYALIIFERLQIPMESFKAIVLQNAKNAAPDARVVQEEQRRVNGVTLTCMEIVGTTQGIQFHYFGYYYTGTIGSIQVITYTGENLFDEYRPDFENLLNGFAAPSS
jgi:hypothetical protein